jgi:hypothetical protein
MHKLTPTSWAALLIADKMVRTVTVITAGQIPKLVPDDTGISSNVLIIPGL